MTVLALPLILGGLFFLTVSALGVLRFPDFYSRTHAVGKAETLGAVLVLGGLALSNGLALSSLKLVLILLFIALANPTATHALARSAFRTGLEVWTRRGRGGGEWSGL